MKKDLSVCLEIQEPRQSIIYIIVKRMIDIIMSICGIIVLSPIYIVTAMAIKLESKGPIIFKQRRVGKNSKVFYIYKFRSMMVNTPNLSTAEFKNASDFTTKVGKFIRKTSIDELPQLFNILKGDMSIVGPRPVIEKETDLLELRQVYKVDTILPGVTGWAQVNGRDNVDVENKVKYDYEYLLRQGILFDFYIIIKTVKKVLSSDGIID